MKNLKLADLGNAMAYLQDGNNSIGIPVVNNISYYNERDILVEDLIKEKCQRIQLATTGQEKNYEKFVRQKSRRPNYDIYACFQSYNEAFKAFFPFIKIFQKTFKKNDIILNLWDRTGWMGAILQGLFPNQEVITLWEGDKDILGYKGFHFWYGKTAETPMKVAFANLNEPLPFADESIALVFGLDTFHRFHQSLLFNEVLRICKKEGAILFPHVHLTNNEPDPFFERGERQLHGLTYDAFFKKALASQGKKGYVFPEPELFLFNEFKLEETKPIVSQPATTHYNALLAILPEQWEQQEKLRPFQFEDLPDVEKGHILVNPLIDINYSTQRVRINPDKFEGQIKYLLDRHPVYQQKINLAHNFELTELQTLLLYYAEKLYSIETIAATLKVALNALTIAIKELADADIIQVFPVSQEAIRLQKFVSTQSYVLPKPEQTINALWERALKHYKEQVFIISELDESEFTYEDCAEIINQIQNRLIAEKLTKGDQIGIISSNNFEAVLTVLAGVQLGIVVIPIESTLPPETLNSILGATDISLLFCDQEIAQQLSNSSLKKIIFDGEEEEEEVPNLLYFSEWLSDEEILSATNKPIINPETVAVILYTSGSTGIPKGVMLSHGHLVRSSRLITESFHWKTTDKFFTTGELSSMSGLRNNCFAPLEVGASVIIPKAASKKQLFQICESIGQHQATILGTTPALLAQMEISQRHVKPNLTTLRQIICTASPLSLSLKKATFQAFKVPILNYYGLTETTGICISENMADYSFENDSLGKACNCIVQVVDAQGKVLPNGTKGELRLFGDNIMLGYFKDKALTEKVIKKGWFYTGDYAIISADDDIQILGRKRNILKTPEGQLIYGSEFEGYLNTHPNVVSAKVIVENSSEFEKFSIQVSLKQTKDKAIIKEYLHKKIGARNIPFLLITD